MADRERRKHAVEAYCGELCGLRGATVAVSEIIVSLDASGGGDAELLRATRVTAAECLPATAVRGGALEMVAGQRGGECALTPSGLAARANGTLDPTERATLEQHLEGCLICRAVEIREARAERAFAAVVGSGAVVQALAQATSASRVKRRGMVVFPAIPTGVRHHTPVAGRWLGYRSLTIAAIAVAAVIAGAVLVLNGASRPRSAASHAPPPAPLYTASPASRPTKPAARRPNRRRVRHDASSQTTASPSTTAASDTAPGSSSTSSDTATASGQGSSSSDTQPATTTSSPGGSGSLTQEGGTLPAQPAPTQGIAPPPGP